MIPARLHDSAEGGVGHGRIIRLSKPGGCACGRPSDRVERPETRGPAISTPMDPDRPPAESSPLRSVHTTTFPQILAELGLSVWVTTYQAGKLVVLRAEGGTLNTHFRTFHRPMGLALAGNRLAVGTTTTIEEFHNVPDAGRNVKPP